MWCLWGLYSLGIHRCGGHPLHKWHRGEGWLYASLYISSSLFFDEGEQGWGVMMTVDFGLHGRTVHPGVGEVRCGWRGGW